MLRLTVALAALATALGCGDKEPEDQPAAAAPPPAATPEPTANPAPKPASAGAARIVPDPDVVPDPMDALKASCDQGDAKACYNVGVRYWRGKGPDGDFPAELDTALVWLGKSCDLELTPGCNVQATLIGQGKGAPADQSRATEIFTRACDLGDAQACGHLGVRYYQGNGPAQDFGRAREILTRACDGGYPDACKNLAVIYNRGQGVDANPERAVAVLEQACNLQDKFCGEYAYNLHKLDPSVEPAKLTELMRRGCDGGDKQSCKAIKSGL